MFLWPFQYSFSGKPAFVNTHTHTKVQPRFGGMLTLGVTFGGLNDFHAHAAQVCLGTERNPTHVFGGKRSCTLGRAAGNFGHAGSEQG